MMKLRKHEKSTMRSVCMTDTEYDAVKKICGDGSISKGVRNMYYVISSLMEHTKAKDIEGLVNKLNSTFKAS